MQKSQAYGDAFSGGIAGVVLKGKYHVHSYNLVWRVAKDSMEDVK